MTSLATFPDEESARAVADLLRADGFQATAAREAFAGEDDDEDHAWAVRTDAPAASLAACCEAYDGWLDSSSAAQHPTGQAGPPRSPSQPMELPTAPRRHHRPR